MSEIANTVKEAISELINIEMDRITLKSRFTEDLGMDSLDLVEFIMEMEEEFGREISDSDAQKISTVGDAVSYIENRLLNR